MTYALTVTNVGTQDATGVVVTDILPEYTTFVSARRSTSLLGDVLTLDVGNLAAGASATLTVTVVVDSTIPAGVTEITNEASVRDDGTNGPDPTPLNNTAIDTDTLVAAPDLQVTKTDLLPSAQPGQTLNYTLTITQRGQPGGHRRHPHRHPARQHHASSALPTAASSPPAW